MKSAINFICAIFISFAVITVSISLSMSLFSGKIYIPYTWTITGHTVIDESYTEGKYYQIGDDLRIILCKDKFTNNFDTYRVYKKVNGKYEETGAWTFSSIHRTKLGMIWYIKVQYLQWESEQNNIGGKL